MSLAPIAALSSDVRLPPNKSAADLVLTISLFDDEIDEWAARSVLVGLSDPGRFTHPWLTARLRLRCPKDDRDLGTIALDEPIPKTRECPWDGEVQLDPTHAQVLFVPTDWLLSVVEEEKKASAPGTH